MYRDILSCYMSDLHWRHQELKNIDPTSEVNMLPLSHMYMGAKVALLLTTAEYKERRVDMQYFLKKVQDFYIEATCQIKQRFPIGDPLINMFQVLDPNASHSTFPSLVPPASSFPNINPKVTYRNLITNGVNLCWMSSLLKQRTWSQKSFGAGFFKLKMVQVLLSFQHYVIL